MIVLKRYRKGQKSKPIRETRTFPIWYDDPIVEYLLEWLDETEGYLFPTKEGTDHMTETRAYQIIRELGKRLHPPYHITPQCFREQRKYHLAEKKGFVRYDIQAYLKLERTPTINGHREIWQNLLNVASPPKQEKVYEKRPYDAYKDIRNIVISARKEVDIIDPFVDEKIFKLYLEDIQPNVNIKLITKNMYGKFREVAKRFKVQKPSFEIRVSNEVHDRYLIIDDRVWVIGQSLKDAGMKPLYIIELDDKKRVLDLFQKLWSRAKKELS